MFDEGRKRNCEHSAELIAFVYGECGKAEADSFEAHLSDCDTCSHEVTSFGLLRASLGDIREDILASAPILEIPTTDASSGKRFDQAVLSIFGGTRSLAAAAAVAITLAGLFAIYLGGRTAPGATEFAANTYKPVEVNTSMPTNSTSPAPASRENDSIGKVPAPLNGGETGPKVVAPKSRNQRIKSGGTKATEKAPTLSNYEEEEDRSLRLSDLFEDIGE